MCVGGWRGCFFSKNLIIALARTPVSVFSLFRCLLSLKFCLRRCVIAKATVYPCAIRECVSICQRAQPQGGSAEARQWQACLKYLGQTMLTARGSNFTDSWIIWLSTRSQALTCASDKHTRMDTIIKSCRQRLRFSPAHFFYLVTVNWTEKPCFVATKGVTAPFLSIRRCVYLSKEVGTKDQNRKWAICLWLKLLSGSILVTQL